MRLIDANALYEKVDKPPMRGFVHVSDIDTMPIINTESLRSHGKWIPNNFDNPAFFFCSKCNCVFHKKTNFCPNCGAKMEKEENNDTE